MPKGWIPGEVVFVPARGATAEDDGWLISISTHETENAAQLPSASTTIGSSFSGGGMEVSGEPYIVDDIIVDAYLGSHRNDWWLATIRGPSDAAPSLAVEYSTLLPGESKAA